MLKRLKLVTFVVLEGEAVVILNAAHRFENPNPQLDEAKFVTNERAWVCDL